MEYLNIIRKVGRQARALAGYLALTLAVVITPLAQASKCEDILRHVGNGVVQGVVGLADYAAAVWDSKGARLLVKPTLKNPKPTIYKGFLTPIEEYMGDDGWFFRSVKRTSQFIPTRILGLFRGERGHIHDLVFGDPRYAVSPLSGINYCLLDRPIYHCSVLTNAEKRYVASFLLSFVAMIPIMAPVPIGVYTYYEYKIDQAQERAIVKYKQYYLDLIRYDVKFADIKAHLIKNLRMTSDQSETASFYDAAIDMAYIRDQANKDFYQTFDLDKIKPTVEQMKELIGSVQFVHLRKIFLEQENTFQSERWQAVVNLNWAYHWASEMLPIVVDQSSELQRQLADPRNKLIYEEVLKGLFLQKVLAAYHDKLLSRQEAISLLGEWLNYKTRLTEVKVLKGLSAPADFSLLEDYLIEEGLNNKQRWALP